MKNIVDKIKKVGLTLGAAALMSYSLAGSASAQTGPKPGRFLEPGFHTYKAWNDKNGDRLMDYDELEELDEKDIRSGENFHFYSYVPGAKETMVKIEESSNNEHLNTSVNKGEELVTGRFLNHKINNVRDYELKYSVHAKDNKGNWSTPYRGSGAFNVFRTKNSEQSIQLNKFNVYREFIDKNKNNEIDPEDMIGLNEPIEKGKELKTQINIDKFVRTYQVYLSKDRLITLDRNEIDETKYSSSRISRRNPNLMKEILVKIPEYVPSGDRTLYVKYFYVDGEGKEKVGWLEQEVKIK